MVSAWLTYVCVVGDHDGIHMWQFGRWNWSIDASFLESRCSYVLANKPPALTSFKENEQVVCL